MARLALYRKYRSQSFGDLVGQNHVVRALQSALEQGRPAHAYLFTGPRGTGKTSTARLLAKALNCEQGTAAEPCNACEACTSINDGSALDVIEIDAASESKIEEVRESIVAAVAYQPAILRHKVFIIDEVHDLSPKAFDALLKTIEEPPEHVVFILATTEAQKVPATVRSRCQRFEFYRGNIPEIVDRLRYVASAEGMTVDDAALGIIARMADGGYRDAISLLEQVAIVGGGTVTVEAVQNQLGLVPQETVDDLLRGLAEGNVARVLDAVDLAFRIGRDPRSMLEALLTRSMVLTRAMLGIEGDDGASAQAAAKSLSQELGVGRLTELRRGLVDAHHALATVTIPQTWLEAKLVSLATTAPAVAVASKAAEARPAKGISAPALGQEAPVAVPSDPELARMGVVWNGVYEELAGLSRVVKEKLAKVSVARLENNIAVIEFARVSDLDYVQDRPKAQAAIREAWGKHGGSAYEIVFAAGAQSPSTPPEIEVTAVDSMTSGEPLVELAREVFGQTREARA